MRTRRLVKSCLATSLLLALCCFLPNSVVAGEEPASEEKEVTQSAAAAQEVAEDAPAPDKTEIVVAAQGVSVDAEEDRGAKFELNRDIPPGVVLNYLNWNKWSAEGSGYIQLRATDALQNDQQFNVRGGWMGKVDLTVDWNRSPHRYGDGATFIPGRVTDSLFLVPNFVQQNVEDPDGNGIPFYEEPAGVDGDNALAANLMNELIDSSGVFDLATRREEGGGSIIVRPTTNWTFSADFSRERRDGLRPAGNGTYQRIRDGYDYWFSIRGQELPATTDYVTNATDLRVSWANGKWFADGGANFLNFDNDILGITYDVPYWFTDTLGDGGVKRGLWGTGRASMPPSNNSWNLFFNGGVVLSRNTQITATINRGRLSQDDPFLPVTTNTALIATRDINGDGVTNSADDPTTRSTLPQSSVNAEIDTTAFNFVITSRPHDRLKLTGRVRIFDYDATQDLFDVGFRAEYKESQLKPDFHKAPLNHVPVDFRRSYYTVEGVVKATDAVKVVAFGKWIDRDYDKYVDTANPTYVSRTAGTRAVSSTLDSRFGVGLVFGPMGWLGGQLTYEHASRTFDGSYQPGYDGEFAPLRQFDIAKRDRDSFQLDLSLTPIDRTSFGFRAWYGDNDYPESEYGLQKAKDTGVLFDVNTAPTDAFNLFAYVEWSEYQADSHLRTKCSNCEPPPGATWTTPWGVPNFDWFTNFTDTTVSVGGGVVYEPPTSAFSLDVKANYLDGTINQLGQNPGQPLDLLRGTPVQVALAVPFPDQDTGMFTAEVLFGWKVSDIVTVGVWYLFEDFALSDFMWDPMDPYGANYLEVDDATRYLFLDARYTGYTANVVQAFLTLAF